uniref:Uncharacterized protein n=1 Tax=Marseillevirus LCMAC101 TaxID=2506602 RepID=A0A481YR21_9VIRU|nr:MAG: hypothetical protein LCMAC101_00960 [Marseillevirus LCMAC101]
MIRTFHFSSNVVGGYQVKVDLDTVETIKDIEQICTAQMIHSLLNSNLTEMLSKVENREFHIHNVTMEEIKNNETRMFYICDRC